MTEDKKQSPENPSKAKLSLEELEQAQGGYTATQERPDPPPGQEPSNP